MAMAKSIYYNKTNKTTIINSHVPLLPVFVVPYPCAEIREEKKTSDKQ